MKFKVNFSEAKKIVETHYDIEGYSFICNSYLAYDAIIQIRYYLELPFSFYDKKIQCAEGLCAYTMWKEKSITPPLCSQGSLIIDSEKIKAPLDENKILPVYEIKGSKNWPVFMDPKTGWICIGDPEPKSNIEAVEFATDTIAVLDNGELIALWIKPKNLLEDFKKKGIEIGK